jgi:hypothetical protein
MCPPKPFSCLPSGIPQKGDAYRVYDADEEHNRLRRESFAKICRDIARVQFEVDR